MRKVISVEVQIVIEAEDDLQFHMAAREAADKLYLDIVGKQSMLSLPDGRTYKVLNKEVPESLTELRKKHWNRS